jgi:phage I-like protein
MRHSIGYTSATAIAFQGDTVPEWVQLFPKGPNLPAVDGRAWTMSEADAQALARAFNGAGRLAPVDFEHATHRKGEAGDPAPAVGWISEVKVEDGVLKGRVEWNEKGRTALASREYRYISPGFNFDLKTRRVTQLVSAGLTNVPAFTMPALARASNEEDPDMDKAVLEALGLPATASTADAVVAINKLSTEKALATARAETPDPARFVPKADYELATARVGTLEAKIKAQEDAEIVAAVDAACAAGKIAPASKEYHLATCRSEGGLDRFKAFVKDAPVIAPPQSPIDPDKPKDSGAHGLSSEELAICRMFNTDPATFAKAKTEQKGA